MKNFLLAMIDFTLSLLAISVLAIIGLILLPLLLVACFMDK